MVANMIDKVTINQKAHKSKNVGIYNLGICYKSCGSLKWSS